MQNSSNPLKKHFRNPAMYLKLPSGGLFWKEGSIELDEQGQLPVYPMTTQDEITLKIPDALMSGDAVVTVIRSCIPGIKDPWSMPSIDVDAVLIAIRIASYGDEMTFETTCPHCKEQSEYGTSLNRILDNYKIPDFSDTYKTNDLTFFFTPQTYKDVQILGQIKFQEEQIVSTLQNSTYSNEEKSQLIDRHFQKLVDLNLDSLTRSTDKIVTIDKEEVSDKAQIKEYYQNAPNQVVKGIQKFLEDLIEPAKLKSPKIKCTGCETEYNSNLEFDYSSFFG